MQMFFKLGSAREPRCYASFDKKAPSGIGEGKERTFFLPFRNSKLETRNLRRSILARSNRIRLGEPVGFSDLAFLQYSASLHTSMTVREVSSVELQAIGENCRYLTTMKFTTMLSKDLANIIVCNFPSLERLSFRCNYACIDASMSLIIGLPNLKIFNLSHCIFTQNTEILGMRPKDELVQAGTKKLVRFVACCSECKICQDVWKHANNPNRYALEFRYAKEERWKTDEIKELEL
ncbi:unnamed protein product [Brassica oleracea var. botrytis]